MPAISEDICNETHVQGKMRDGLVLHGLDHGSPLCLRPDYRQGRRTKSSQRAAGARQGVPIISNLVEWRAG
jgi:hypothetical protein